MIVYLIFQILKKRLLGTKILNIVLQPVLRFYSRYTVNDSFEVVDRIRNLSSTNTFMTSFDVKKLQYKFLDRTSNLLLIDEI